MVLRVALSLSPTGETIVNFVYALRMKNKHIKMPTPA